MDLMLVGGVLFAVAGGFHAAIGLLAGFLGLPPGIVGLSARSDRKMWGRPSKELLEDRVVRDLRTHHAIVISGLLVGFGVVQMALGGYAASQGMTWAIVTLTAMGVVMVPYWAAMVAQFVRAGVRVGLGDVQPFVWVHMMLWLGGVAFAWAGWLQR